MVGMMTREEELRLQREFIERNGVNRVSYAKPDDIPLDPIRKVLSPKEPKLGAFSFRRRIGREVKG